MKLTLCFIISIISTPLALGCIGQQGGNNDWFPENNDPINVIALAGEDNEDGPYRDDIICALKWPEAPDMAGETKEGVKWEIVVPGAEFAGEGNEDREQWEGNIGNVPFDCMTCICQVESNCSIPNPICRGDGPSESCGFYQIKENYWTDGGAIGESWKACAAERQCSEDTIQGYMNRYATEARLKHKPTCEDFSRIHYGGPTGYKRASTLKYWNKVNECLAN